MVEFLVVIYSGVLVGLRSLAEIAAFLIPVMVVIEFLKESGILGKISSKSKRVTGAFGLPGEAALPATTGVLIGLIFGAGVIMESRKEGKLDRGQLTVIGMLVGPFHSLIEDTAVWVALGASFWPFIITRTIFGVIPALVMGRINYIRSLGKGEKGSRLSLARGTDRP